jgi:uncharacterized protein
MMVESFEINSRYNSIRGLLTLPDGDGPVPCVVLSHGLISSKESSKYVALSDVFAGAGIASCRFDFHGCGESGGRIEETTLTIRLENLDRVVDLVGSHGRIRADALGLLGSSFGGSASLIKAARDARVRCASLWATPHRLGHTKDMTVDGIVFDEALFNDFSTYDLLAEARNVSRALVIHGDRDDTVPWQEGHAIFERLREPRHFELIEGGDHTFTDAAHRERAFKLALEWFVRYLTAA